MRDGDGLDEKDYLRDIADSLDELCTLMQEFVDILKKNGNKG